MAKKKDVGVEDHILQAVIDDASIETKKTKNKNKNNIRLQMDVWKCDKWGDINEENTDFHHMTKNSLMSMKSICV